MKNKIKTLKVISLIALLTLTACGNPSNISISEMIPPVVSLETTLSVAKTETVKERLITEIDDEATATTVKNETDDETSVLSENQNITCSVSTPSGPASLLISILQSDQMMNPDDIAEYGLHIDENTVLNAKLSRFNINSLYNFTKSMTTGVTYIDGKVSANFPYEGLFGTKVCIENNELYIKAYSNLNYKPEVQGIEIKSNMCNYYADIDTDKIYNEYTKIELPKSENREILRMTVVDNEGRKIRIDTCVYVNNKNIWLCEASSKDVEYITERKAYINKVMSDLNFTPDNQLDVNIITYPTTKKFGRCDTNRWAELSKEIITDENWSNGYKVMMIHNWICDNIAYDWYRVNTLQIPRDFYYNDHNGKYSVWDLKTGVCFDVTHIFLIMCRYNNIPCMTVENDNQHQWNLVYINNKWYEMDIAYDMYKCTNNEDVNDVTIDPERGSYSYDYIQSDIKYINSHLWTEECITDGEYRLYSWYYDKK